MRTLTQAEFDELDVVPTVAVEVGRTERHYINDVLGWAAGIGLEFVAFTDGLLVLRQVSLPTEKQASTARHTSPNNLAANVYRTFTANGAVQKRYSAT